MRTGTSWASARRKSVVIASTSASRVHNGSDDSTSVAPRCPPSIVLISRAAALTMGSSVLDPRACTIDSRTIPMRTPWSAPGVPADRAWLAYEVPRIEARGTVVYGSRGS